MLKTLIQFTSKTPPLKPFKNFIKFKQNIPKSQKNFRINFNKFILKTKNIEESSQKLSKTPLKPMKASSVEFFSKTFTDNFSKKTPFLSSNSSDSHSFHPTIFNTKEFDDKMGKPFIMIKVAHLTNYKDEPLNQYDLQMLDDLQSEEMIRNMPIDGYSRWINNDGNIQWRLCLIKGFDADKQLFDIQWKHNNRDKKVTRLNLMVKNENLSLFEERREKADNLRYRLLYLESYKKSPLFLLNFKFIVFFFIRYKGM